MLMICLVLVFSATFNNISVISVRSVLLVEGIGVLEKNYRPAASHRQTLSHNVISCTPRHERGSNSQLYSGYRHCSCYAIQQHPYEIIYRCRVLYLVLYLEYFF